MTPILSFINMNRKDELPCRFEENKWQEKETPKWIHKYGGKKDNLNI